MRRKNNNNIKNYVIVCAGILCLIAIFAILFLSPSNNLHEVFDKGFTDDNANLGSEERVTVTPTMRPTSTPVPDVEVVLTPERVLDNLMPYVLNTETPYGYTVADEVSIEKSSLMEIAGIKERGRKIGIEDVSIGDVGVFSEYECICIGHDWEGNALFAYAADFSGGILPGGGIFVGYSREQKDSLLEGMYPVPCEVYYDCVDGTVPNELLFRLLRNCSGEAEEYADNMYLLGRIISEKNVDLFKNSVSPELMLEHNVRFSEKGLPEFLDRFLVCVGADEETDDFTLIVDNTYFISDYVFLSTEVLSLDGDSFLKKSGEWDVTLNSDGTVSPYLLFDLYKYIGYGFEQAQQMEYIYDADGNVVDYTITDIPVETGFFLEGEDGQCYYYDGERVTKVNPGQEMNEEEIKIASLGEWQYLLFADDGYFEVYDMRAYSEMPEEELLQLLLEFLQELNEVEREIQEEYDENYVPEEPYEDEGGYVVDPYDGSIVER